MTRKTVRVRKGTMAGVGGGTGFEQGKGYTCLSFADWRRNSDRTGALLSSIDWVGGLWVKSFYRVTKKTVRVRKGTMAGGGGSAGFEQEKGRSG